MFAHHLVHGIHFAAGEDAVGVFAAVGQFGFYAFMQVSDVFYLLLQEVMRKDLRPCIIISKLHLDKIVLSS